jgi:glycine/D-amino acid oxidase-like deaminating enzyme
MYDLCIIGAGMIGAAAARHATVISGLNTCLIGPTEPKVSTIFNPKLNG